jgi:hypothetical protein
MPIATGRRQFYDSGVEPYCQPLSCSGGVGRYGLRSVRTMTKRQSVCAQLHCAPQALPERCASFLRPRPYRSRIGVRRALLFGRRRHTLLIVLDLRCVWLPAFSIAVLRQVRLRAGAWWRDRLGHHDVPFPSILPETAASLTGISARRTMFDDCPRTACAIFLWLLRESASVQEAGSAPRD